jgi:hypothetical protein
MQPVELNHSKARATRPHYIQRRAARVLYAGHLVPATLTRDLAPHVLCAATARMTSSVVTYHLGGMGCSGGAVGINLIHDLLKVGIGV